MVLPVVQTAVRCAEYASPSSASIPVQRSTFVSSPVVFIKMLLSQADRTFARFLQLSICAASPKAKQASFFAVSSAGEATHFVLNGFAPILASSSSQKFALIRGVICVASSHPSFVKGLAVVQVSMIFWRVAQLLPTPASVPDATQALSRAVFVPAIISVPSSGAHSVSKIFAPVVQ